MQFLENFGNKLFMLSGGYSVVTLHKHTEYENDLFQFHQLRFCSYTDIGINE